MNLPWVSDMNKKVCLCLDLPLTRCDCEGKVETATISDQNVQEGERETAAVQGGLGRM